MSEHTKGPWRIGNVGSVVSNHPVPEIRGSDDVDFYGGHLVAETLTPSNARLIAAAPEMLEALQNIENDDGHINAGAWKLIKAAIAKATGEEVGRE